MAFWLSLKSDIPFSREEANHYLPWVIGLMVCLAGLFLAAALSIHQISSHAGRLNVNSFQVFVPYDHPNKSALSNAIREAALGFDTVERVSELSSTEMGRLLAPWTGGSGMIDELPLPVVIEITLTNQAERMDAISRITARLKQLDAAVEVESYQQWVNQLMQFSGMLRILAIVLALLIIGSLVAIVIVMARTSLKLHFKAVQLLHNVGARDEYIIRQFVINGFWMTVRGALPGAAVAATLFIAIAYFSEVLASPLLPDIEVLPLHLLMFLLLPVLTGVVAYLAVRVTVQSMLESIH